ncbi:alpha/beta fold hydrolase [Microbacterium sp. NPDC019599]|uniref:alpha/beta hydrolase n=1 Tax=Microbacterium sp. NPDC019599 TaxID=3154690 RepID=UPI0033C0103B
MTAPALTGRRSHRDEPHFLTTEDGVGLTAIRVRGPAEPAKGPVLLLHGVGMRAESFRPPAIRSLVDVLIDDGWDVWLGNWRGSIDLPPMPWTLDDVVRFDIPALVTKVVAETGAPSIKVVAHCQGAAALSMAVVAGLVPEVETVVANGVALHPVVPGFAKLKLHVLRPMLGRGEPYVDIAWGDGPERGIHWVTRTAVRVTHAECHNPSCNMASFALGAGHPALWRHENLDAATHRWLGGEFGRIPLSWYAQMAASDRARQYVSVKPRTDLPRRWGGQAPASDARFVLMTGELNKAFLPASQRATYEFLERHQPGRHALKIIPGYSHADVFVGRKAHVDVFPGILEELSA